MSYAKHFKEVFNIATDDGYSQSNYSITGIKFILQINIR